MKKFLVLYKSTASAAEQMTKVTPEQAKVHMAAWMTWMEKAGPAIVDRGAPLGNPARVTSTGSGDGDTKLGGYSILQAESKPALGELLKGHPHFMAPDASIEVFELLQMPGM
jgi:hypothetical protein